MKGLIAGIKDFIPEDTLRNFSYLFSVAVGSGRFWVCTFDFSKAADDPASASCLVALLNEAAGAPPQHTISLNDLRDWCTRSTDQGPIPEDVMNHFWEIDNKPVEDTLFWEEARVDLSSLSI
jgi:hypothetical protein